MVFTRNARATAAALVALLVAGTGASRTFAATPGAEPVPGQDTDLVCDAPVPQFPPELLRHPHLTEVTVVVRGRLMPPDAAIGEALVERRSDYPLLDEAALKAFRGTRCSVREEMKEAVWIRRPYLFRLVD